MTPPCHWSSWLRDNRVISSLPSCHCTWREVSQNQFKTDWGEKRTYCRRHFKSFEKGPFSYNDWNILMTICSHNVHIWDPLTVLFIKPVQWKKVTLRKNFHQTHRLFNPLPKLAAGYSWSPWIGQQHAPSNFPSVVRSLTSWKNVTPWKWSGGSQVLTIWPLRSKPCR